MDLIEVNQASDSRRQQLCLIDLHSDVLHLILEQVRALPITRDTINLQDCG